MTEVEILNTVIGGVKIQDMTSLTFCQWLSKKINGITAHTADSQTLIQRVAVPPFGRMTMEEKIDLVRRLERLNIPIT